MTAEAAPPDLGDGRSPGGDTERRPLLTNRQSARYLNVGLATFYDLLKHRAMPPPIYITPNTPRWVPEELEAAKARLPRAYPDQWKVSARRRAVLRAKQDKGKEEKTE